MNNHRYVGLAGTIDDRHRPSHGRHGVVESCDGNGVMLLLDSGRHEWVGLPCFVPDDAADARRRLTEPTPEWTGPDRWQHWAAEFAHHPDDRAGPAPAGFVQIGPWESVTFVSTSPSEPPIRDWRRPLRRVQA